MLYHLAQGYLYFHGRKDRLAHCRCQELSHFKNLPCEEDWVLIERRARIAERLLRRTEATTLAASWQEALQ